MFKEKRKQIDGWTFNWVNQKGENQFMTMALYECSGFLSTEKYIIEIENKSHKVIRTQRCLSTIGDSLMWLSFEIQIAIIIDKYILDKEGYYSFEKINKNDYDIMKSLNWGACYQGYPQKVNFPKGNEWIYNPKTKDYFAFFCGEDGANIHHWGKQHNLIIESLKNTSCSFINLKISNKYAYLENCKGEKIYDFENPNHILFLAAQSNCLQNRTPVWGKLLLESYYKN